MTTWLLVTCGLPFSGKSTLSRAVADCAGVIRVSVDELIPELADTTIPPTSDIAWRNAYRLALLQTESQLDFGESVIFDSVGHTRKNRYRLLRLAERHGASMVVIHLAVDRAEALSRLKANLASPTRPNVPVAGFAEIAKDFEPPDCSESVLTFEPDTPIANWIDQTLIPYMNGA